MCESLPSDADSGYEPSPAFTSARASFEWPPASEYDAAVEPSEMRSAAIPIPGRRQQPPPLWPSDTVDVATQTSSLGSRSSSGCPATPRSWPGCSCGASPTTSRARGPPNGRRRSFPLSFFRFD
ncbi:hypothetical protein MTO96_018455 [Rhipicephalus appendiculatus]